jgi:site-specific recombinase XerD
MSVSGHTPLFVKGNYPMMQPYQSHQITDYLPQQKETMSLEQCIAAWLKAKKGRSGSAKTETAYRDGLTEFRSLLASAGRDLDADASIIAPLAEAWAALCKREDETVSPATYNQRLAILSSFYQYAIKHEVLPDLNPIERVERRVVNNTHAAQVIGTSGVKTGLKSIDRSTLEGKRDYAMLAMALETGRRVSELANLRYGHIHREGDTARVIFEHCKGNKTMTDKLSLQTTTALFEYLYALYGKDLYQAAKDSPVWISFSDRNKGKPISARTLQRVCEKYLGTSKMHATRHTAALNMHNSGATLKEIGKQLGHSNLATTSRYLETLISEENKYATALADLFGI